MLWLPHLTHHYRSISCLTWIVMMACVWIRAAKNIFLSGNLSGCRKFSVKYFCENSNIFCKNAWNCAFYTKYSLKFTEIFIFIKIFCHFLKFSGNLVPEFPYFLQPWATHCRNKSLENGPIPKPTFPCREFNAPVNGWSVAPMDTIYTR